MNYSSTWKDAYSMLEEAIRVEISGSAQWRWNNPSVSGIARSSPGALSSGQDPNCALPDILPLGAIAYPNPILAFLQQKKVHSMIGTFSALFRVWFTVDNRMLIWDFRANGESYMFEEIPDIIIAVGTPVPPKAGIFQPQVTYILPIATSTMVILLGISVSEAKAKEVTVVNLGYCVETKTVITRIVTCDKTRRIFCSGVDGNVYELSYGRESSFVSKIGLTPYGYLGSATPVVGQMSAAFMSIKKLWSKCKPAIRDMVMATSAQFSVLITLDDDSNISSWILTENGLQYNSFLPHKGEGKFGGRNSGGNCSPLVRIFIVEPDQEDCNLVAVALNGDQFRYRYSGTSGHVDVIYRCHIPSLIPPHREISACGVAGSTVFEAYCEKNSEVDGETPLNKSRAGVDELLAVNASPHVLKPHHEHRHTVTFFEPHTKLLGNLESVEAVTEDKKHRQTKCNDICLQVTTHPQRVLFAHQQGISLYMICRPIDILRMVLETDGPSRSGLLQRFSSTFNSTDYASMLLQLATGITLVSESQYESFEAHAVHDALKTNQHQGQLTLEMLGARMCTPVSSEVRILARNLLRQAATPTLKEGAPSYGQKTITVDLSSFAAGVIALTARALSSIWTVPLSKVPISSFGSIKEILTGLLQFMSSVEIGQMSLEELHIPYPVQFHRNRIVVNVPEHCNLSISDANKLQMVMLNCCYELILKGLQAIHLLRQWGAAPLPVDDGSLSMNQILNDKEKAQAIGEHMCSSMLNYSGMSSLSDPDPLRTISVLKKDCPYFFDTVDISGIQARCEMRRLGHGGHLGSLTVTRCTEWAAQVAPHAAQYWLAGSLSILCQELCGMKREDMAIKLLLHAAQQLDTEKKLFVIYSEERHGHSLRESTDPNVYTLYEAKKRVLETVVSILEKSWFQNRTAVDELLGGGHKSGKIWEVEPADEMSHFFLFDWISAPRNDQSIRQILKEALVSARSPHLQKFLSLNASAMGEEYTHFLRSQRRYKEAIEEGLLLAQSSLSHIPLDQRVEHRRRCLTEALECARECGSDHIQLLEKRLKLIDAQKKLLTIILSFTGSAVFQPQRSWQVEGRVITESQLVKEHSNIVASKVLSGTELLRIAAMYPLFGGAELQLDILMTTGVQDPSTYAICVSQAYDAKGYTISEISRRLLERYYSPSLCFPLTYVIRMLEAEEYHNSPQGSSRTVELLLQCKVDSRVAYHAIHSIIDGTDNLQLEIHCVLFESRNVSRAFLIYSLAVAACSMAQAYSSSLSINRSAPPRAIKEDILSLIHASNSTSPDDQIALRNAEGLLSGFS